MECLLKRVVNKKPVANSSVNFKSVSESDSLSSSFNLELISCSSIAKKVETKTAPTLLTTASKKVIAIKFIHFFTEQK